MPPQHPGNEDVTLGEVNRNLIDLRQVVQAFVDEVRTSYVRRDVYEAESSARGTYVELLTKRVDDLEDTIEENEKERLQSAANNRRLALTGLVFPLLVAIVVLLITAGLA